MTEIRTYEPTWRDKLARLLLGDEPSDYARQVVGPLLGSTGLGQTGIGAVDFTPFGLPLAKQEAQQAAESGNWPNALLAAGAFIPGAKGALTGAKNALTEVATELPMDLASRLMRASEMGFRPETVYHGTMGDISAFDLTRGGAQSGSRAGRLGVSVAPDASVANEFAVSASMGSGDGSTVLPLRYRSSRQGRIELDGQEKNNEVAATLADAWDQGFDSVLLTNYSTPGGQKGQKVVIIRNPNQLRSVNAAFDPAKIDSANLLAGLAGLTVGGALAGSGSSDEAYADPLMNALLERYAYAGPMPEPIEPEYGERIRRRGR